MDGSWPGAPHRAGAVIIPALEGVDKGEGAGRIRGDKRDEGCQWC